MGDSEAQPSKDVQKEKEGNKCDLCNICYLNDSDLLEHYWSLMHHIRLEQRKRNSVHTCSLCCESCPTLPEYSKHLNNDRHRRRVEEERKNKTTSSASKTSRSFTTDDQRSPNSHTDGVEENFDNDYVCQQSNVKMGPQWQNTNTGSYNQKWGKHRNWKRNISPNSNFDSRSQWNGNRDGMYEERKSPLPPNKWHGMDPPHSNWQGMETHSLYNWQEMDPPHKNWEGMEPPPHNSWQGNYQRGGHGRGGYSSHWRGNLSWRPNNRDKGSRNSSLNTSGNLNRSFSPVHFQNSFSNNSGLNWSRQNTSVTNSSRSYSPDFSDNSYEGGIDFNRTVQNHSLNADRSFGGPPSRNGQDMKKQRSKNKNSPGSRKSIKNKGNFRYHRSESPRYSPRKPEKDSSVVLPCKSVGLEKSGNKGSREKDKTNSLNSSRNKSQINSGASYQKSSMSDNNSGGVKVEQIKSTPRQRSMSSDSSKITEKYSASPVTTFENRKRTNSLNNVKLTSESNAPKKMDKVKEMESKSSLPDSKHSSVLARAEAVCKEIRERRLLKQKQIQEAGVAEISTGRNQMNPLTDQDNPETNNGKQPEKMGTKVDTFHSLSTNSKPVGLPEQSEKNGADESSSQTLSQYGKQAALPDTLKKQLWKTKLGGKLLRSSSDPYDKDTLIKMVNAPRSRKDQMRLAQMLKTKPQLKSQRRFNLALEPPASVDETKDLEMEDLPEEVRNQIAHLIELDVQSEDGQQNQEISEPNVESISGDPPLQLLDLYSASVEKSLDTTKDASYIPSSSSQTPISTLSSNIAGKSLDTTKVATCIPSSSSSQTILTTHSSYIDNTDGKSLDTTKDATLKPLSSSQTPLTTHSSYMAGELAKNSNSEGILPVQPQEVTVKKEPVDNFIDESLNRLNAAISDFKKERVATDVTTSSTIEVTSKRKRTSSVNPEETLSETTTEKMDPKRFKISSSSPSTTASVSPSCLQPVCQTEHVSVGPRPEMALPSSQLEAEVLKNLKKEPVPDEHSMTDAITQPINQTQGSIDIPSGQVPVRSFTSLSGTESEPNQLTPQPGATSAQEYHCMGKVLEISLKEEELRKQMQDVDKHIEKCAVILEKTRIKMDVLKQKKAELLKEEEELRNCRMHILHGAVQNSNKGTSESSFSLTSVTPSVLEQSEAPLSGPCSSTIEIDVSVIKSEPPDDSHCEPDTSMELGWNVSAADSSIGLGDHVDQTSSVLSVSQLSGTQPPADRDWSKNLRRKKMESDKGQKLKNDHSEEVVTSSTTLPLSEIVKNKQITGESCKDSLDLSGTKSDTSKGGNSELSKKRTKKQEKKMKQLGGIGKVGEGNMAASTEATEHSNLPYTMQYMGILEENEELSLEEMAVNFAEQQHASYLFLEESDFEKQTNCSLSDSEVLHTAERLVNNPMVSSWNTNDSFQDNVQDSNYGTLSSSSGLLSGSEVFKKPPSPKFSPKLPKKRQQETVVTSPQGKNKTRQISPSRSSKTRSKTTESSNNLDRITEVSSEENAENSKSKRKCKKKVSEIYPDPASPVKKKLKTKRQRNRTLSKPDVYDISSESALEDTDQEMDNVSSNSYRKVRKGMDKKKKREETGNDPIYVDSESDQSSETNRAGTNPSSQEKKNIKKRMHICPKKAQLVKNAMERNIRAQTMDKTEKGTSPDTSGVIEDTCHQFVVHSAISAMQIFAGKLYAGCQDGVKTFDLQSGEEFQFYKTSSSKVLTSLHVTDSRTKVPFLYVAQSEVLTVFNTQSGKKREVSFDGKITCFCEAWNFLYIGLDTGEVKTIDLKTQRLSDSFELVDKAVNSLCGAREGSRQLLCVASSDALVTVRDARSGLLLRTLRVTTGLPVSLQEHNNYLYCGTSKGSVIVFDVQNGEELHRFPDQVGAVYHLLINNGLIYIGGYEHLLRVFDIKTRKFLHLYYGAGNGVVISLAVTDDMLYTGTREGIVESVKVDPHTTHMCKFSSCEYRFGCQKHVLHHLMTDHLYPNRPIVCCQWEGCTEWISVRNGTEKAYEHFKGHLDL
ncbi:zinc finger protein 106 isoform X3 [Lingula anatina]|uniref:Zinc finger protein 106 isoform X1 n=1 Tax=Lingula anatina TaxID=7574 RepID=A0A1S3K155_LINAN|nr:zinc finger protein 106 isoform X1 [Lingula anatina]XP_013416119.1 zinc finger protein 106 isoform X2 [Lingula anatina]XP_013416121.1 zinc finger protein 106 isoform X3 [Lingula anatina]|eukprot:XP_013416118.1 zinc finger protein 106 isoform X1 [Lingula anatina]